MKSEVTVQILGILEHNNIKITKCLLSSRLSYFDYLPNAGSSERLHRGQRDDDRGKVPSFR